MGPGTNKSDFKIAGMGDTKRVAGTVDGTVSRDSRMVVRTFVPKHRVAYKYCGAHGNRIILPVARMIAKGRFFSCSTGCGKRIRRVAPTQLSRRATRHMQLVASTVCSVLGYDNVVHISCVVAHAANRSKVRERHVGVLRIGAAPKVATADFVPRRIQTTKVSVGSILSSVVRSGLSVV